MPISWGPVWCIAYVRQYVATFSPGRHVSLAQSSMVHLSPSRGNRRWLHNTLPPLSLTRTATGTHRIQLLHGLRPGRCSWRSPSGRSTAMFMHIPQDQRRLRKLRGDVTGATRAEGVIAIGPRSPYSTWHSASPSQPRVALRLAVVIARF
jgi:hypothetical protein